MKDRLRHKALPGRSQVGAPVGIQLGDVWLPGNDKMEIDEWDLKLTHDGKNQPAPDVVFQAVPVVEAAAFRRQIDEDQSAPPPLRVAERLQENPSKEIQVGLGDSDGL